MHKTSGQRRTSQGQGIFICAVWELSRLALVLSESGFFNEQLAIPGVRNYMSKQTELTCEQRPFTRCKQWHKLWHSHILDSRKYLIVRCEEPANYRLPVGATR